VAAGAEPPEGALRVETLAGEAVVLALAPEERALLVHFFATWCPECVEELPALARALGPCAAAGVRVAVVNVGEDRDEIERFLAERGLRLPVLRDPRGRAWREVSGAGLPMNLVWTRDGRRVRPGPEADWPASLEALGCPSAPGETAPPVSPPAGSAPAP
jgi:thiol-disulfide isomerase/thioredoxin